MDEKIFSAKKKKEEMTWTPSEGLIISLFGGMSALLMTFCACVLKSRCRRIKSGCCELDRDVLPPTDFEYIDAKIKTAVKQHATSDPAAADSSDAA